MQKRRFDGRCERQRGGFSGSWPSQFRGVQAQGKFPSRPMTIICPWGAGGGTDAWPEWSRF